MNAGLSLLKRVLFAGLLSGAVLMGGAVARASDHYGPAPKDRMNSFDPSQRKAWQEASTALPPWPGDRAWQAVAAGLPGSRFSYALNMALLRVGSDGVVRYAVAITSPTGARNVLYEGLRCQTEEYKTYAVGGEETWQEAVYPAWSPLPTAGAMAFRRRLFRDYLCDEYRNPVSEEEILARVRRADGRFNEGTAR